MSKYRISVSIDEQNYFWIVIDIEKLIKNPTKDDLKGTKLLSYNKTNICPRCRDKNDITDSSILRPGKSCREKDEEGKETGRWICNKCKSKHYRDMPDSHNNIKKSLRDRRTGNLDPSSNSAKGDDFEELTSIWKGVKVLSKENDNYREPLDHSVDSEGKRPQTKGRLYDEEYKYWNQNIENELYKVFDYLIFYCASKDGKIIERIYEFPKKEIERIKSIAIVKNPTDSWGNSVTSWCEKYRIKDEDTIKKVNEIWKKIINT